MLLRRHERHTMQRIGLFGGSFDPVHLGHLLVMQAAREELDLARLFEFVVIPRPGQAETPFSAPFRGRWLAGFPLGVSSSQIRARVKAGLPIHHLVSEAVAETIRNNRLYL